MKRPLSTLRRIGISFLIVIIIAAFCIPEFGGVSYAATSPVISTGNHYSTVPTVAIRSLSTEKYLAADTSGSFDKANLILQNTSIKNANKFDLYEPCYSTGGGNEVIQRSPSVGTKAVSSISTGTSGTKYALKSIVNQRFFGRFDNGGMYSFYFGSGYITDDSYIYFINEDRERFDNIPYGENFYIVWSGSDGSEMFVGYDAKSGKTTFLTEKFSKAERFTMELVDDNQYTQEELNILESDEWFNIDDKYVGYWDIQAEIGGGYTYSLETLGYTIFKQVNQTENPIVIETWIDGKLLNMTFGVGVKKKYKGPAWYYDVIITCQGTAGYPGTGMNNFLDAITNITNEIDGNFHKGYKLGAKTLTDRQYAIYGDIDGKRISLANLIGEARRGNAHFTILGHSMGGAIAQCLGYYLAVDQRVPQSAITGRTFESALVSTKDFPIFSDWVNICLNTDGVSNGIVPGSILEKAGIHRLGKTIYLYDPSPESDTGTDWFGPVDSGISQKKHCMDQTPYTVMRQFYGDETDDVIKEGVEGTWITVEDDLESNNGPYASSGPRTQFPEMGTEVKVVGYKVNSYNNRWYLLEDGSWMYGGNIQKVETFPKTGTNFYVRSSSAPIRKAFYQEASVLKSLSKGDKVTVDMSAINSRGNTWYHVTSGGTSGWVWEDHLVPFSLDLTDNYKKVKVCCPVDVDVLQADGTPIVSIRDEEIVLSLDETKAVPVVDDDQKTLYIIGDEDYQIRMSSRDYGEMEYIVESGYDEEAGGYTFSNLFDCIELVPDKVLGAKENPSDSAAYPVLYVIDPETNSTVSEVSGHGQETETESETFFKYSSIKGATVAALKDKVYTGKAIKPAVSVRFNGRKLVNGTDYKVTYSNCTKIGKAKVTIRGIDLFTGSVTKYFKIKPAKVTGLKLTTPKSGQLKVKYTKGKGGVKYRIEYRLKGNKTWKKVTTTGTSKLIKNLKKGKTYQVRVQAYKTVSGVTYAGSWSSIKSIKVKK